MIILWLLIPGLDSMYRYVPVILASPSSSSSVAVGRTMMLHHHRWPLEGKGLLYKFPAAKLPRLRCRHSAACIKANGGRCETCWQKRVAWGRGREKKKREEKEKKASTLVVFTDLSLISWKTSTASLADLCKCSSWPFAGLCISGLLPKTLPCNFTTNFLNLLNC